jgi:hypothetical protein
MIEIAAFATALGHVTNIGKTMLQAHTQAERDAVRLAFSDALLAMNARIAEVLAQQSRLLEANESLKQQLVAYERWDQESARYSLQELAPGIVAYALKPDHAASQPKHWLCPTCHSERKPSILQPQGKGSGTFNCPRGHPPILMDEY